MDEMGLFQQALPAITGAPGVACLSWISSRPRPGVRRCQASVWVTGPCLVGGAALGAGLIFVLTQAGRTDDLNEQPWLSFVLVGLSGAPLWAAADGMFRRIGWDERKAVFRKMLPAHGGIVRDFGNDDRLAGVSGGC